MQITLLKNTNNTNSFSRNFVKETNLEGTLKEGSDMLNPEILIQLNSAPDYNMMYIPAFNRYYFVGFKNVSNTLWSVYAKEIDVLYSYKSQLLSLNAIIDKQERNFNRLIDDGSFIRQVNTVPEVVPFSSGFDATGHYVLTVAGA